MKKNLAFMVQFDIKPEYLKEFTESLLLVLNNMSVEESFVSCYLHKDPKDETKFAVYEIWSEPSMEAFFENQLKTKDYRQEYEKKIATWLKEDRIITVLEPMQEWHK